MTSIGFEDTDAISATDASGLGNQGGFKGPSRKAGKHDNGLRFHGGDDFLFLAQPDIAGDWSAALWVQRTDLGQPAEVLLHCAQYSIRTKQLSTGKIGITRVGGDAAGRCPPRRWRPWRADSAEKRGPGVGPGGDTTRAVPFGGPSFGPVRIMRALAVAVPAAVLALLPAAPASAAPPVELAVSVPKAQFSPDETVPVSFTVTNRTAAACSLVAVADGTVQVVSVTRDGTPVAPVYGTADYYNGIEDVLRSRLVTAQPGQSASFTAAGLFAVVPLPAGDGLASRWDIAAPGRYEATVTYQAPVLAGVTTCVGTSATARVSFAIGAASGADRTVWIAVGAAALLILALVVVLLWRRRRPATAAVAILLALPLVATDARPAQARVLSGFDVHNEVEGCLKKFSAAGDPANLLPYVTDPKTPPIKVRRIRDTRDSKPAPYPDGSIETFGNSKRPSEGSEIYWDPDPSFSLDGVPVDACSALYHELAHAMDINKGALGEAMCGTSGVKTKEVRATTAENAYRRAVGLGTRPSYHGTTLPPDPGACEDEKQRELRKQGVCAKAELGTCSRTDGDPHLDTFDKFRYDLQLVGEFVAARAASGDPLEIQVRQSPAGGSRTLSVNSAVALRVGTHKLGFYLENGDILVRRDGQPVAVNRGSAALDGGGSIERRDGVIDFSGDGYTVVWPDGSTVWLDRVGGWGLRIMTALARGRAGGVAGLFGNFDGNPANDLADRSGAVVADANRFGDAWRVTDAESLFDYAAGQSTATFTDRTFPDKPMTVADLPADRAAAARELCQQLGVTDAGRLEECVLDVAATGQALFALSAAQSHADSPPPSAGGAVPTQSAPPSGPVSAGQTMRDGSTGNGTVTGGAAVAFPLDLAGAPGLWVDDTTGSCDVTIAVARPTGRPDEVSGCYGLPVMIRESEPGPYTLTVRGNGTYAFRIVTLKPRVVAAALGRQVSGALDVPGRVDHVEFDAAGATGVRVSGGTGAGDACDRVQLRVFNARTGERLGLDVPGRLCDGLEQDLPDPAGRYYLEVTSYGGGPVASYSFNVEGTR